MSEHQGVLTKTRVEQRTREDALDGEQPSFEPVRVSCPVCEREGTTTKHANTCGGCGAWFVVVEA